MKNIDYQKIIYIQYVYDFAYIRFGLIESLSDFFIKLLKKT